MLRQTLARAFAAPAGDREPADPGKPPSRLQAVDRLFAELREAVVSRLAEEQAGGAAGAGTVAVGPVRAHFEGVEFVLEGPARGYRFLNGLRGAILVFESRAGGEALRELLGVLATPEGFRPLRKPSLARRSGFDLASVRGLAERYLAASRGAGQGGAI
jgi:hypothetical protein